MNASGPSWAWGWWWTCAGQSARAIVFDTKPAAFAVREPWPGVDLDAREAQPGLGVAPWLRADDAQALHDRLVEADVTIAVAPFDGPFGRTFTFLDRDAYALTVHD